MTRGFAPQPPGRGRGRGRGQVVRPLTPDASNAPEASSQPLPTPLAISAPDEPPQSPLGDPTPLGPSTTTPMTSRVGRGDPLRLPPAYHPYHIHLQHLKMRASLLPSPRPRMIETSTVASVQ
ncbi:hypothetical protein Salat_1491800 [Sesamum alatum]|uniref:Uncharacterized protein n=1 Tax=Sesamum alatum TaxID=300844 RepID=A0AAE1YBZ8_9LAMI|nr:hypothetical protein Salat_1491800 [Sesamum alatum]